MIKMGNVCWEVIKKKIDLQPLEPEKARRNKQNIFLSFRPLDLKSNGIEAKWTPVISAHMSVMTEEDAWGVAQSSPKNDFVLEIGIFQG